MRIIAKRRLVELATKHGDCLDQVVNWRHIASKAAWQNLSEVRQTFRNADVVGDKTVFNIKGNQYRLVTQIHYDRQTIYIRDLLRHAEYDKGAWKH